MSQESTPFVSVVVCAFNEEKLINSCITGLATQTYPFDRYEILVIDDESTDNTFNIVADFINGMRDDGPCIRLARIKHGGLSVARNSGIELSKGEIIAFIDGDAVPDSIWLGELVKPFLAGADYVGGRINLLNNNSWVARFLQRTRYKQFFGSPIFYQEFIGCNMAFRREVFDAVGGFYENFVSRGDETTIHSRIRPHFRYAAAPDATVLHEHHDSFSGNFREIYKSATLSYLCKKALGTKMNWKTPFFVVEQFFLTLFPILLCIIWFNPSLFLVPLIVSILAVVRRFYIGQQKLAITKSWIHEFGFFRGTIGHFLYYLPYNIIYFCGWIFSPWLHRNADIIPPMTTRLTVLKSFDRN